MSPDQLNSTQVSFGNFPNDVRAAELAAFLESKVGLVPRCKMKKVSGNVPPHAFVHFESPKVAREAVRLADLGRLVLREKCSLMARMDDRSWMNGRRGLNSKVLSYIQLVDVKVELGSVTAPRHMLVSWRGPKPGPVFRIEPAVKRLRFFFTQFLDLKHVAKDPKVDSKTLCDIMMEIRIEDIKLVQEIEREVDPVLLLRLSCPPWIFYRTAEDDIYEFDCDPSQLADDEDPWIRCLDIITPNKSIGRCLDYMLTVSPRQKTAFMKAILFFQNHNVLERSRQGAYTLSNESKTRFVSGDTYFFSIPHQRTIPFELMFLVNALVHYGIIHWSALTGSFYRLLHPDVATVEVCKVALTQMLTYRNPIFDAAKELQSVLQWAKNSNAAVIEPDLITEGHMLVRRLIITPTRAICLPPEIELSNRVLRHFSKFSDRFLRVSFLDENMQSVPSGSLSVQVAPILRKVAQGGLYTRTALYDRVVSIMKEGFKLCGREYSFLAFSAGQLRESSAWFFASNGDFGASEIRQWMGTFPDGNVAKHAARMGQCFSATVSTLQVLQSEQLSLPDIKRGGYDFSDGCGKIDPEFAQLVARILKLEENPPSAYQIRYAGYKGVVAVWPIEASETGKTYKLALRDSMKKFYSNHCQLEICGWSKFLPCFLNRQIITLLSSLHVEDKVFKKLQDTMVETLTRMVNDRSLAYTVLKVTSAGDSYSTALRMLFAGFEPKREPHLKAMLVAIRAGQLEDLVQKTKIFVPKGRWLLGCLDETSILNYGQCFLRVSDPPQVGSAADKQKSTVITGTVIMTKNPCMHPGDIRVLVAVDVPALYHMVDCLVVPQTGPRPHTNEASGSDLDGDVYFVSWDLTLIPPSGSSCEPMDYSAAVTSSTTKGHVKTEHVVEFFAKHMVNDSLGKICNAHVVHADISEKGALDEKCIYLAELAAKAVDYPKTGKPAVMPFDLKPSQYPDFMEKEESNTYTSVKVIGTLYRDVQGILPDESAALQLKKAGSTQVADPLYDYDLVVDGFEAHINDAWAAKQDYDKQLRAIMCQFNISSEGEVVTGHLMVGAKTAGRRLGDVKERVRLAYHALLKEFSHLLLKDEDDFTSNVYDKVLLARASAWYHVTYHHGWYRKSAELSAHLDGKQGPFLSFAWVAVDQLVAIKIGKLKSKRFPGIARCDSLTSKNGNAGRRILQ